MKNELEFDFDIFFSKMSDAEFDDFNFYTIDLALEHLNWNASLRSLTMYPNDRGSFDWKSD